MSSNLSQLLTSQINTPVFLWGGGGGPWCTSIFFCSHVTFRPGDIMLEKIFSKLTKTALFFYWPFVQHPTPLFSSGRSDLWPPGETRAITCCNGKKEALARPWVSVISLIVIIIIALHLKDTVEHPWVFIIATVSLRACDEEQRIGGFSWKLFYFF